MRPHTQKSVWWKRIRRTGSPPSRVGTRGRRAGEKTQGSLGCNSARRRECNPSNPNNTDNNPSSIDQGCCMQLAEEETRHAVVRPSRFSSNYQLVDTSELPPQTTQSTPPYSSTELYECSGKLNNQRMVI